MEERASRVVQSPERMKTVTEVDAQRAMEKMLTDRKPKMSEDEIKMQHQLEKEMYKNLPGNLICLLIATFTAIHDYLCL